MKKILGISFLFVLGVSLALVFLLIKVPLSENLFIHSGPKTYPLWDSFHVEQNFISKRPELIGFRLKFKKTNDVEHPVLVEFVQRIKEGSKEKEVIKYRAGFSSKDIQSNRFYSFWLPEAVKGKDQKYWLQFSASVASESASISPIVSRVDNYLDGETSSSQGFLGGDLVFEPIYKVRGVQFLSYYLNKIAFGKPAFFNKFFLAGLFAVWTLMMVSLVSVTAASFFKKSFQFWQAIGILLILVSLGLVLFFESQPIFYFTKVTI